MASAPSPAELAKTITIYGRKPVLEALLDPTLDCRTLHLADSNQINPTLRQVLQAASQREVTQRTHSRERLAHISRNRKQDQGVALDILCPHFATTDTLLDRVADPGLRVLALDGVTNPQNAGMAIRSAVAAGIDGILYPRRGVAALGPLVIKASAGTVFRAPLITCPALLPELKTLSSAGFEIATLEGGGSVSLFEHRPRAATIYVLGGETEGVSDDVMAIADHRLHIPMANGVESLNVAVAAALVAYADRLSG